MNAKFFASLGLFVCMMTCGAAQAAYILDTSFAADGKQEVLFDLGAGNRDVALRVFKATGGGYWLAGYSNRPVTAMVPGGFAMTISKLTIAGALDTSYDGDGRAILDSPFLEIDDVAMDANQNLIYAGVISDGAGGTDVAVMKVLSNGQLDGAFGLFGIAARNVLALDTAQTIALDPAGHIAVSGSARADNNVATGSRATIYAFENDGSSSADINNLTAGPSSGNSLHASTAITYSSARGALLLVYEIIQGSSCGFKIDTANLSLVAGSISVTRNNLGTFSYSSSANCAKRLYLRSIAANADGSAGFVGFTEGSVADGRFTAIVGKLGTANALDSGFNGGQLFYQSAPFPYESLRYTDMKFNSAGQLVLTGTGGAANDASYSTLVQMMNANGTPDTSFSTGSFASMTFHSFAGANASIASSLGLSVLTDGNRIVCAGARLCLAPSDFDFTIAVYKPDAGLPFANGFE
jgi:hypothetical protein